MGPFDARATSHCRVSQLDLGECRERHLKQSSGKDLVAKAFPGLAVARDRLSGQPIDMDP